MLDAHDMDIPCEGHATCDYEDHAFEDRNPADVPTSIHELHRNYGDLNHTDLSGSGTSNMFVHYNFHTKDHDAIYFDSYESLE